jgi:hypothetical protein
MSGSSGHRASVQAVLAVHDIQRRLAELITSQPPVR